jgi:hypothetical protein
MYQTEFSGLDGVLQWLDKVDELVRQATALPQWRAGTLEQVSATFHCAYQPLALQQ